MAANKRRPRGERWRTNAKAAGHVIEAKRARLGLTYEKLGELAGTNRATAHRVAHGASPEISAGEFLAICRALKVNPFDAWYGQPEQEESEPPISSERPSSRTPAAR